MVHTVNTYHRLVKKIHNLYWNINQEREKYHWPVSSGTQHFAKESELQASAAIIYVRKRLVTRQLSQRIDKKRMLKEGQIKRLKGPHGKNPTQFGKSFTIYIGTLTQNVKNTFAR